MFIASSVHCCAICCITVVASLYLKLVVDVLSCIRHTCMCNHIICMYMYICVSMSNNNNDNAVQF